jgi:hypothetical protein
MAAAPGQLRPRSLLAIDQRFDPARGESAIRAAELFAGARIEVGSSVVEVAFSIPADCAAQ